MFGFSSEEEWRSTARALPSVLADIAKSKAGCKFREAIVVLWTQMTRAPAPIIHSYSLIAESRISKAAEYFESQCGHPAWGFVVEDTDSCDAIVEKIGGLLRALEMLYMSTSALGSLPADPVDQWLIRHGDAEVYVVPLARTAWRRAPRPEADMRPFWQRGLTRLRILPVAVDGARVRLYPLPGEFGRTRDPVFGAAVFPGLTLDIAPDDGRFHVRGVQAPDFEANILNACERSHRDGCLAAVFPELTIDDASLRAMKVALMRKPWGGPAVGSGRTPAFIVAGTWHQPCGDHFANVASVLDGNGFELFTYRKRFAFRHEQVPENIVPGDELPILVTGYGLITIAICLDFCIRSVALPFPHLDVDFVLVPSFGNAATMDGHLRTAYDLLDRCKTRSFVVQQVPMEEGGCALVLPPATEAQHRPKAVPQPECWCSYPG